MSPKKRIPSIASTLVTTAFEAARIHGIETLIVQADDLRDIRAIEEARSSEQVLWLTSLSADHPVTGLDNNLVLPVPAVALKRTSQLQLALLLAVLHQQVGLDETVLCLAAREPGHRVDTLFAASPSKDLPWFGSKRRAAESLSAVVSNELARLIAIALRLAAEGREGRPLGTIFVLGGNNELTPYLRQLVLNPCAGHSQSRRNIHEDSFFETIREFAALDGAFIVNKRGIVEAAGVYLDAPSQGARLPEGLGARHSAAAGITAVTKAVALVVSESSGTITAFHGGRLVLKLEKPS
jgi:diadenylate cyclase